MKKTKYDEELIGALDQGTSSTRFIVFSKSGSVIASSQKEHKQYYPQEGLVEHDPQEIWENSVFVIEDCLKKANLVGSDLVSIGITNQRETTIVWNKHTSVPYYNAIVWMDTRSASVCEGMEKQHGKDKFRDKTGLPISPYFSGTKIAWILQNVKGVREAAEKGDAICGTIDSWLLWKLSGGKSHLTDCTNASRYLLMDLQTLNWDKEICAIFNIPLTMLPTIRSSSELYFECESPPALKGVKVSGVLGDQQAALVGHGAFKKGMAKTTFGTGLFMLMNTGRERVISKYGLLTTVAYQMGRGKEPVYALEGSVAIGGALIQWLRDNLQLISSAGESEAVANQVKDNGGVYVVPAFSGLYAPYWEGSARGIICGLTRYVNKSHIVRAALESTAYQTYDVFSSMEKDCNERLREMKVDGGMANNKLLMQFQADIINANVSRPAITETTALGACFAAGLGVGVWKDLSEICPPKEDALFLPRMEPEERERLLANW